MSDLSHLIIPVHVGFALSHGFRWDYVLLVYSFGEIPPPSATPLTVSVEPYRWMSDRLIAYFMHDVRDVRWVNGRQAGVHTACYAILYSLV